MGQGRLLLEADQEVTDEELAIHLEQLDDHALREELEGRLRLPIERDWTISVRATLRAPSYESARAQWELLSERARGRLLKASDPEQRVVVYMYTAHDAAGMLAGGSTVLL